MATRLFNRIIKLYTYISVFKYKILSNIKCIKGTPIRYQPLLLLGNGIITFGRNVAFGVYNSPSFFNSYGYLEARSENAQIIFEDNIWINNNFCIIAERSIVYISSDCLIGNNVTIYDSDFHGLNPAERTLGKHKTENVYIDKNVFIGSNVTILKGVTIGINSVIGAGSIVTTSIPSNCIASGNPAKVIKFFKC